MLSVGFTKKMKNSEPRGEERKIDYCDSLGVDW